MHNAPPPLNALRAFEAAARHLSLTKAAVELNVTPGALSHRIRGLESYLGVKLFDRGVRSIVQLRREMRCTLACRRDFFKFGTRWRTLARQSATRACSWSARRVPHLEMAGAAALPLFQRLSGNRRTHFFVK